MADSDEVEPHFRCYRKECDSEFTRTSPCYARTCTGVQTRAITCEACLHSYEIRWASDRPTVRLPTKLIAPWTPEGKRLLLGYGLYDASDPRVYADGIVPDRYKPQSARQKQQ